MRFQLLSTLTCLALSSALPTQDYGRDAAPELRGKRSFEKRDGVEHTIFEHEATGAKIDFVTNSGICETTPGVNQYSGYLSVGSKLPLALVVYRKRFSDIEMQAMKICGSGFSRPETILPQPLWPLGSMEAQAALP
jgi:hypothetical protein